MNYDEKIRLVGKKLIANYRISGKVIAGVNGPYDDRETEVRDLSHLIIITAIEILKYEGEYWELLSKMANDLLSMRGANKFYVMREKEGKDSCNGVIGNAWVIEALVYLYKVYKDKIYLKIAFEIYEAHKFQEQLGLWGRPGMGIGDNDIDYTLNHQLWFAASLYELNDYLKNKTIEDQLHRFMEQLSLNFNVSKNGRITHGIYRRLGRKLILKNKLKSIYFKAKEKLGYASYAYKEDGYQLFNLVALARIYRMESQNAFFQMNRFKQALKYASSQELLENMLNSEVDKDVSLHSKTIKQEERSINIYAYPYNVPGFEYMYIKEVWEEETSDSIMTEYLSNQFELTFSPMEGMFGLRCHDKVTINYRIYEFYRGLEIR